MTRLVLLGPPGVGKGTQAQRLAAHLGLPAISTGDLFRAARSDTSPIGRSATHYVDTGTLVPDTVTNALVTRRLEHDDAAAGFVLDGFPRTIGQATALDDTLSEHDQHLDAALAFHADHDELLRRLSGRRTCRECSAVWHVQTRPPRQEGRCDHCGGPLYRREDDIAATIAQRLRIYAQQAPALLEYYSDRHCLIEVNTLGSVQEVGDAVLDALDRELAHAPVA